MKPSSRNGPEHAAGELGPDSGARRDEPDAMDRRDQQPRSRTPEGASSAQRIADSVGPQSDKPAQAIPPRDSRRRAARRDYGPPHGHVIGCAVGEPPPRARDTHRPYGRIGPYGLSPREPS